MTVLPTHRWSVIIEAGVTTRESVIGVTPGNGTPPADGDAVHTAEREKGSEVDHNAAAIEIPRTLGTGSGTGTFEERAESSGDAQERRLAVKHVSSPHPAT